MVGNRCTSTVPLGGESEMYELKRQGGGVGVISLIIFSVMVIVGVVVYSSIDTSFSATSLTGEAAAAAANVSANTYGAFNLVSVGPIIFGAVIILGIVGMLYLKR